jgi:hypothetical protein
MSTIKVDNIRIASESVSRPVTGVAALWGVTENDGTMSNTFGVSTTVDNEPGKTTVNFAIDFASTLYPFVVTSQSNNARTQSVNAETVSSIVMHNKTCDNVYIASRMRFSSTGDLA